MQDYWEQSTNLVKDPVKFLDSLLTYDKDAITAEIIEKADPYMRGADDFEPRRVKKVSKACTSICMWARAMHTYYNVSLAIEPKRAALAGSSRRPSRSPWASSKEAETAGVEAKLKDLNDKFEAAKRKQDDLKAEVARCEAQLDRAGKLIGGLGGEKIRWENTVASLTERLHNVVGDVVTSSGRRV